MINMPNIQQPNINRWQVLAFDINGGRVTLRFLSAAGTLPQPLWIDVSVQLSDVAGKSDHVMINPSPVNWNDKIIVLRATSLVSTPALANALTNAQDAYRGAASHIAGLRAMEGSAMSDNWVAETFNGT